MGISFNAFVVRREQFLRESCVNFCKEDVKIPDDYKEIPNRRA